MSFKCNKCGTDYEQKVNFCRNCGSPDFSEINNSADMQETVSLDYQVAQELKAKIDQMNVQPSAPDQSPVQQQPAYPGAQIPQQQIPQQQVPQQQFQQQTPQPQKRRGLAWWHILLIVLGGVTIISATVVPYAIKQYRFAKAEEENMKIIEEFGEAVDDFTFDSDTSDDTITEATTDSSDNYVEFEDTFGEVKDGYYVNEWAGFQFEITDKWPESELNDYEATSAECVFYSNPTSTRSMEITSHKFAYLYTEDEFLDITTESFEEEADDYDLSIKKSEYRDMTIAGETYRVAQITVENMMEYYICIREIDDYVIRIGIVAYDEDDITEVLDSFEAI